MKLIDGMVLYEATAEWEEEAMAYFERLNQKSYDEMTEKEKIEWHKWNAIWGERLAFKYDVIDAPIVNAIPIEWIEKWLEWGKDSIQRGRYLGAVSAMLSDWDNEVDIEKPIG